MENLENAERVKFEAVFYGTEAPLVIFKGPEMVYEMLNDTYQSIYPNRQLLGKPLLEAVPELTDSAFPEILKKVYETGEHFVSQEGVVFLKNKLTGETEERYFDTTFSRIQYGGDKIFRILATPKEVTEKVFARQKLEQSLCDLEDEKELRERFVSTLTHDLRTPLAIIKFTTQMLQSKITKKEDYEKSIQTILNNVDRADRMIRDLLDANRLKANEGLHIFTEHCQLENIISLITKDLDSLYGKRCVIQNTIESLSVFCDQMAVHRIIENLASNAIKYGSADTLVTINFKHVADTLEISVHNWGNPIAAEQQKDLFNPYHRTEFASTSQQKGWGIGLSLVQGLAQAHKGKVCVESTADHGTTFTVYLPIDAKK